MDDGVGDDAWVGTVMRLRVFMRVGNDGSVRCHRPGHDVQLWGCDDNPKNVCKHSLSDQEFIKHDAITFAFNYTVDGYPKETAKEADLLFEFTIQRPRDGPDGAPLAIEDNGAEGAVRTLARSASSRYL